MKPANKFAESLLTEAHNQYLRRHLAEDPFPLDGSDWSRLVALRLHRARHPHCCSWENLLTRLHSSDSPLEREHLLHSTYLNYWFLNPYLHYPHLHREVEDADVNNKNWSDVALRSVMPEVLEEVEKQWLRPASKLFELSPSMFWVDEVAQDWRTGASKRTSRTSASLPVSGQGSEPKRLTDDETVPQYLDEEGLTGADGPLAEKDCEEYLMEVDRRTLDSLLHNEAAPDKLGEPDEDEQITPI